jgi:hypothetical protein
MPRGNFRKRCRCDRRNSTDNNGIDLVLNDSEAIKNSMKWNIGQEVQVTVARDGKELTFPVKTVENRQ